MPAGRRVLIWLLVVGGVVLGLLVLTRSSVSGKTCTPWEEGTRCGAWDLVYDGFGAARGTEDADGWRYRLQPQAVERVDQTSAALAVSTRELGDLEVSARMRTIEQLRRPEANPWEVAWLLWHYTDDQHFYYIVLKPNGWELGKAHPDHPGAQRFLATGSSPTFPVGPWYEVHVRQVGDLTQVSVDGEPLVDFRDDDGPYLRGAVGLYTEDAAVEFSHVRLEAIDAPTPSRGGS
ncbi:family 16 glycoside hydrolase [Geodermatophilus sp. SYSU D01105]